MSKRLIPLVAIVVIIAAIVATCCVTIYDNSQPKSNEYTYEPYQNGYLITGEKETYNSEYVIPSTYTGLPVLGIKDGAFKDCTNMTKVVMPDSIEIIGDNAFEGCSNLTEVDLSDNVTSLPDNVFKGCSKLSSIMYKNVCNRMIYNGDKGTLSDIKMKDSVLSDTSIMNVAIQNSDDGDTKVQATFNNVPDFIKKITVKASLNDKTDIIGTTTIDPKDKDVLLDFGTYGLFKNIVITAYSENDSVSFTKTVEGISVTADHYNFAYLNATYPVLLFSLDLCHNSGADDSLSYDPTFIYLERYAAYNWDSCPSNVYTLPTVTKEATTKGELGFTAGRSYFADYIGDLYSLRNDSTFTLYCVDNYPELILEMLVDNRIPETSWDAHLLTDGSGTASYLCSAFAVPDPNQVYDEMVEDWTGLKDMVWNNGYTSQSVKNNIRYGNDSIFSMLAKYAYPITKEQSNVDWTTGRLRATENLVAINNVDPAFTADIIATANVVYTNNLLALLTEEEAAKFKELYHFSDEMFSVAREAGKEIMIILGTSIAGEGLSSTSGDQSEFYNYVKMTMDFYGDDYVYYYKGHPGFPTALYPHRQEAFEALAANGYTLYELDNSVAAEVILFYNPDVYMSGWQSTTFSSVESQEMACSLYNVHKSSFNQTYKSLVDMFMSKLTASPDPSITLDPSKVYYLIEYNNTAEYPSQVEQYNKHEIAIYNSTDCEFTFYKWDGSQYNEVDR